MKSKKYNNLIKVISVVYTILYFVGTLASIILCVAGKFSILNTILLFLNDSFILILVWCLSNSLFRITLLEQSLLEKNIITQDDLDNIK